MVYSQCLYTQTVEEMVMLKRCGLLRIFDSDFLPSFQGGPLEIKSQTVHIHIHLGSMLCGGMSRINTIFKYKRLTG